MLFTIDTCIPVALQKSQTEHDLDSILQLFQAALDGLVNLQLTAAFERDRVRNIEKPGNLERAAELLEWVSNQPILQARAGGAFRLDVSLLGGDDLLCDDETALLGDRLEALLPPPPAKRSRGDISHRYSDIDHLLAHHMSKAVAFVTIDQETMLAYRAELAYLGVTVLTPAEAVAKLKQPPTNRLDELGGPFDSCVML